MKKYWLCMLGIISFISAHAKNNDPNTYALMTARDVKANTVSNITVTNRTNQPVPVAAIFIASYDINDCSSCFGGVIGGDNVGGAVVSPVTIQPNQTLAIGQNFLYNMIYNGIYFIKTTVGASPCSLPGCSWPGDTNISGWCFSINLISRHSSYTFSHYTNGINAPANSPPYSFAGNSIPFDYKFSLINPATLGVGNRCIGLVTCNDKTLTCSVKTPQNLIFQPYN